MQTKYKKVQRIHRKHVENMSGGMHTAAAGLLEYLHMHAHAHAYRLALRILPAVDEACLVAIS